MNNAMNKKNALSVVGAGFLVLSLAGCGGKGEPTSAAAAAASPVKVVRVAKQRIVERLTYTGTIEPWRKINITPETAGKVAKIYVDEGQAVAKDQLLAELETESIRLQIKQAEAAVAAAEANRANTGKNKERMDKLLAEKAVSQTQYDQVKLADDAAKAQLEQAQAALNLARHYLDVSILKAPWSGVIASKNAQVGDVINPMMGGFGASGSVLTLVDYGRIKVVLDLSPTDVGRVRIGQEAIVAVSDLPGREFRGVVALVGQTADALSKKFRVEIAADNPGAALRPGMFGDVGLEVGTRDGALAVPQKAVLENMYVFVAEGGTARRREVRLGLQNADFAEVTSGLKEGDVVIVEGNYGLEDGARIEVLAGGAK